jgi:hypothetical protein
MDAVRRKPRKTSMKSSSSSLTKSSPSGTEKATGEVSDAEGGGRISAVPPARSKLTTVYSV